MRRLDLLYGRVYRLKARQEWSDATKPRLSLSNEFLRRMVIVVGDSTKKSGWFQVASITTTIDPKVDKALFVPISPAHKDKVTGMHLHICDNPYGRTGLVHPSFLQVDSLVDVPAEILVPQQSQGKDMELQEKSYRSLLHFLRIRKLS